MTFRGPDIARIRNATGCSIREARWLLAQHGSVWGVLAAAEREKGMARRDKLREIREARRIVKAAQDAHSECQLYRHFDESGRLLYVGISNNHVNRLSSHRCDSSWFPLIASITIEHFNTRADAERAEVSAIIKERPIFNRQHNPLSLVA